MDAHAGESRRLGVAAGRVHVAPDVVRARTSAEHHDRDDHEPDRGLHAEVLRARERAERRAVEEHHEVALRDAARDAADDERHRERGDQRVDAEEVVTMPLTSPTSAAAPTPSTIASQALWCWAISGGRDAGERVGRADREVDAAGDEHERPGRGDEQHRRLLIEDVEQVRLVGNALLFSESATKSATNGTRMPRLRSARRVDPRQGPARRDVVLTLHAVRSRERRGEDRRLRHLARPRARRRCGRVA